MRTFAAVFAGGAVGLLILKLVLSLLVPGLALIFGLFALFLKVVFFGVLAYFVYSLIKGRRTERHETV